MPEQPELLNVGGWTAVITLLAWLARFFVLRAKADLGDMAGNDAVASGLKAYQTRISELDLRISKLEADRGRLVSFCMRVMAHFTGCHYCPRREEDRQKLQAEFEELMKEIAQ
jgi:hypothetical protein